MKARGFKKHRTRWIATLLMLVFVVVAGVLASLEAPYRNFSGTTYVTFERGTGTVSMARALEQSGVIRYGWQFWLARALSPSARLVAGEYRFDRPASVFDVFGRIAHGDIYFVEVSVPEGSNMFDIARLAQASGIMAAQDFLKAAQDPASIHDLDPSAPSLEGYLFPATYRLSHSTTAAEFCAMMTTQFRRQWKKLLAAQPAADPPPASPHGVVTLASLVEKETSLASERPLIAGVFSNRLRLKMKLECDPTTIYAALLDARYRGTIYRSDLESHNPYNTYRNAGLPPGPIANPGTEALAAALRPAQTEYLYFVANPHGTGGHQFSKTLADHDKAVRAYRNGTQPHKTSQRETGAKAPKKT
jgi:UPF0755 protein